MELVAAFVEHDGPVDDLDAGDHQTQGGFAESPQLPKGLSKDPQPLTS